MHESYLIERLETYSGYKFPDSMSERNKVRALMNITMPYNLDDEFYAKQDEYLQGLLKEKTVVTVEEILKENRIALYLGDITEIKADAIVNAGNSALLGCMRPLHYCIDNAIHSFAGLQVRRDLMEKLKGEHIKNGGCIVSLGYNLPSKYIFHTVGPICMGEPTPAQEMELASCYNSCLKKAEEMKLKNIVFCSISTGVFAYPIEKACKIAIKTVKDFLSKNSELKVIFNLFSEGDYNV